MPKPNRHRNTWQQNAFNMLFPFSWDAYAGLPANIAGLQLFNEAFVSEINERANLGLQTGKLIFHSKNCHIYKRQFNLVQELLEPKDKASRMAKAYKKPKKSNRRKVLSDRLVRVSKWEEFKRLVKELKPDSIVYNIEQTGISKTREFTSLQTNYSSQKLLCLC